MLIDYLDNEQTTPNTKRVVSIIQGNDSDNISLNDGDILDVLPLRNRVLFRFGVALEAEVCGIAF